MGLSFVMNVFLPIKEESDLYLGDRLDQTTLQNKAFSHNRSWFHVFMVFLYTFLTINAVQKTRRDARISYMLHYQELIKKNDADSLKARTLHVKGIPSEDRAGVGLKLHLENFLQKAGGHIGAIQIVPPFHKIFGIEVNMRDLRDLNMLLVTQESGGINCCVPRKYRDL